MTLAGVDTDLVRGAVLLLVMLAFLGIWAWSWSGRRKAVFDRASRLPLEEDAGVVPGRGADPGGSDRC